MNHGSSVLGVVSVGPHVTVQDAGRPGHLRYGVPASGPMDREAHAIANGAVGNATDAPAIEISLGGLAVESSGAPIRFAVAGGDFRVERDGRQLPAWCVGSLSAGQRLVVAAGSSGSWCVLAVAGDIEHESWLGSRSVHTRSRFGGRSLQIGDDVTIVAARPGRGGDGALQRPPYGHDRAIRVVLGPQQHRFDSDAIDRLLGEPYRVTSAYDRMGMRLDGPDLAVRDALSIPSEPIVRGAIQVAGDGVPTVLLADHQTVGGYPKIATVIGADLDRLVQHRPGDEIRFRAVSPDDAVDAARARGATLDVLVARASDTLAELHERLASENLIGGAADAAD